jgi:uncharacterized protein (DUF58 family)
VIRVERKPLRQYLFRREQSLIDHTDVSAFDARRYLCAPGVAAFFLTGILAFFSFWNRVALILFLTDIICLAFLFMRTKIIAQRLVVRRVAPPKTLRELESAEIILEIKNRSDFELSAFLVDDFFGPSKSSRVRLAPENIGARSARRISYKRVCDGGMGKLKLGPVGVTLTDVFGIFEHRVLEDEILEVEVHPKVMAIPPIFVRPSHDSQRYGNYETATRGLSVNFAGVRPYERGDSLRHIAWKLSTRGQGILVKEFEKVVNCDVNIVLNRALAWQIGRYSASTWEYGKDVALSLVQGQLDLGNTVAFFTDRSFVEAGSGPDHFHAVARHVANLALPDQPEAHQLVPQSVLATYRDLYPRGSNIFYVTPFNVAEFRQSAPWLKRLRTEGFHVTCIFIDSSTFWSQFIESIPFALATGAKLIQGLDEAVRELERIGITTYVVKNKVPLKFAFKERGALVGVS